MSMFDLGYEPAQHQSSKPGYNGTSLQEFHAHFSSERRCLEHIFSSRIATIPNCPRCGKFWKPKLAKGRKEFMHWCGYSFSPLSGTLFHRTQIPLRYWFYAMLHFSNSGIGVSAPFLSRQLGLSTPAAQRMCTRIRMHLAALDSDKLAGGPGKPVCIRVLFVNRIRTGTRNRHRVPVGLVADCNRVFFKVFGGHIRAGLIELIKDRVADGSRVFTNCDYTEEIVCSKGEIELVDQFLRYTLSAKDNPGGKISGFEWHFRQPFINVHQSVTLGRLWLYLAQYQFLYNQRVSSGQLYWSLVSTFPDLEGQALDHVRRRYCHHLGGHEGRYERH